MAEWAGWLENGYTPWLTYHTTMVDRISVLGKRPNVITVSIWEVYQILLAKIIL